MFSPHLTRVRYTSILQLQRNDGETGYGERYCNYSSPYSSYDCPPNVTIDFTVAASPSDYNRFYNRAYSYDAVNGACAQSNFVQDYQQCNGLACSSGCPQCPGYKSCQGCGTPILIDVAGNGFFLTGLDGGVKFDIMGTGTPIEMSWTARGASNGFLALPGPDGLVHDGKQLFGNATPQPPSDDPNGFAALAVYDDPKNGGNGDGIIDNRDGIFNSLRLWIDANHDGICQPDEMHTLPSLGVNSISLKYTKENKADQYGNQFRFRALVNPVHPDNVGRWAYDVFFVTATASAARCVIPTSLELRGNLAVLP